MSTIAEIEAALPSLSSEDLARVEAAVIRLRHGRGVDERFDGRSRPANPQETAVELSETDALPPLMSEQEANRFDTWLVAVRCNKLTFRLRPSRGV